MYCWDYLWVIVFFAAIVHDLLEHLTGMDGRGGWVEGRGLLVSIDGKAPLLVAAVLVALLIEGLRLLFDVCAHVLFLFGVQR